MGARAIHDGHRAFANQTSSDRIVIRLLAVTNDDLDEVPVFRRIRDRQQQPPPELSVDRAQLIDEAHEVVTPLLSSIGSNPTASAASCSMMRPSAPQPMRGRPSGDACDGVDAP